MNESEEEDVALKLLHTADWHLGRRFPSFDEADQQKLTRARLDVIRRVFDMAEQYTVDAVLCAGDLFDAPDPDRQWWEGLLDCFKTLHWTDRPVFLLPGNHDPLTPKSVYASEHAFRQGLPPFVQVVDADDYTFEINESAILHAAPCRSQAGEKDLAMSLPAREVGDERIRIGMVHGQTFDIEDCQMNFPIGKEAAVKRGLDYLAIGDTHGFRNVPENAVVPTVYPSAPEATSFSERDAGYVAVVFFKRKGRRALVERERVAHWTWRKETARDVASLRRLRDSEDLQQTVLHLTLEMAVSVKEEREVRSILEELKGTDAKHNRVGILQIEESGLRLDTSDAAEHFGELPEVLTAAIARLRMVETAGDAATAAQAQRAVCHLFRVVQAGGVTP